MSDKNISRIKEFSKKQSVEDTIGMILSNRVDYGSANGGMVSVDNFNLVAKDLMEIFPQIKAIPAETKEELQNLIIKIKEEIAVANNYTLEIPTKWDYAMKITNRTKKQIELYEMILDGIIFYLAKGVLK